MKPAHASIYEINFSKDVEIVALLLKDLQDEQAALIDANIAQIEQLVEQRAELLQKLNAAAKIRYEALAANGFSANENGMSIWIKQQTDDKLANAWDAFQQQLIKAKELNRINGMLIGKHIQRNKERLESLQSTHHESQIYGRDGHAQNVASLRSGMAV